MESTAAAPVVQTTVSDHIALVTIANPPVNALSAADLPRVADDSWDPPVTAAVRLVSVVNDTTAHIGQAAYVKGLLAR